MKRLIIYFILLMPFLSACGSIYSNYREVEQIKVIQTMGIDYIPGGVRLSLSSASGGSGEKEPLCFEASGSSISEAMDKIKRSSSEEDLFFAHISRILIGEEAARRGIDNYLNYICRSPELRIDIPIFIVKGAGAAQTMQSLSAGTKGVSDVLESAEANISDLSKSQILSTAEIINSTEKNSAALICALEFKEGALKSPDGEKDMTASIYGYAVIKDSMLAEYIDMEEALGLAFLLDRVGIFNIMTEGENGKPVTMEISRGSSRVSPVWNGEGLLSGIDIYAKVSATVLELEEPEDISMNALSDSLISGLESEVSSRIVSVLQLSKRLQCDFTGLKSKIELAEPVRFRALDESFGELMPELEIRVTVSGELCHTKDLKGA